jgi:phosphoglycerate kinase
MKETLDYGRRKGFKQIIFGHIGREPEKSLKKVRDRLAEILSCPVGFVADWLDPQSGAIKQEAADAIRSAEPGSVTVLENTESGGAERVLWKARKRTFPRRSGHW